MKVLQINATYGYSSTGLIVQDIGDMLCQNGAETFFAYQRTLVKHPNGYLVGNLLDWKIHALACRVFGGQGYYSKIETKKLLKYIEKIRPNVVHLHNLHSNYVHLNMILKYLAEKNIATVITLHDCWYFTGKCFHYADIGCERFKSGCGNCPQKKTPPRSLFFDVSSKVLNDRYVFLSNIPHLKIIGCSDWICDEAKKGILKDCDISRIYNGVDIEIFKPYHNVFLREKYQLTEDTYVVMGMANKWLLPSNKQLLTDTINILNDKLKLMLVGCKEEQISYLNSLSENVIPIGFIKDRMELAKHYSLANVFVNVTHVDTLPTVNMESICCGTPVITYDCCGSPELILQDCGVIVKENDIKKLIVAISERMKKIPEKALAIARLRYNKNECYKEYFQVYLEMLKKKG